jgi:hypothetical protein
MPDNYDDNECNLTICSLIRQAITLEENYEEILLQSDEVDLRINLWKYSINICKIDDKGMPCTCT